MDSLTLIQFWAYPSSLTPEGFFFFPATSNSRYEEASKDCRSKYYDNDESNRFTGPTRGDDAYRQGDCIAGAAESLSDESV
jgi:hypothetical protein